MNKSENRGRKLLYCISLCRLGLSAVSHFSSNTMTCLFKTQRGLCGADTSPISTCDGFYANAEKAFSGFIKSGTDRTHLGESWTWFDSEGYSLVLRSNIKQVKFIQWGLNLFIFSQTPLYVNILKAAGDTYLWINTNGKNLACATSFKTLISRLL